MATTIKLKNGSGAPLAGDLVQGEPALDLTNKRLYTEDSGGTVIEVGTNPSTLTVTGDLAVDTNTLFVDASANSVGIGLVNPSSELHIKGSIPQLILQDTTDFQARYDFRNSFNTGKGSIRYDFGSNEIHFYGNGESNLQLTIADNLITTEGALSVTGDLTVDTNTLFVNSTTNRVGIGEADPQVLLDVTGGSAANTFAVDVVGSVTTASLGTQLDLTGFRYNIEHDRATGIATHSVGSNASVDAITILPTGNVGIGTGATFPSNLEVADAAGSCYINATTLGTDHVGLLSGTVGSLFLGSDGNHIGFCHQAFGSRGTDSGITERMRITSTGNVGIGTSGSELSVLHAAKSDATVVSSTLTSRVTAARLFIQNTNTTNGNSAGITLNTAAGSNNYWFVDAVGATSYGSPLTFSNRTGSTTVAERMRIDSDGNLLVGKTATDGAASVGTELLSSGSLFLKSSAGNYPLVLNTTSSGSNTPTVAFFQNNVTAGSILTTTGSSPSFSSASDMRLKDNITDHESELANVMALRPVRWDWKDEALGSGEGFIAQELEQTAWADLVSEGDDGYKQVSGLGIVETRLIKAIQELSAQVDELKAEVAALKGA
jgi:hypothetical protein